LRAGSLVRRFSAILGFLISSRQVGCDILQSPG
jgi:hypothetical protein